MITPPFLCTDVGRHGSALHVQRMHHLWQVASVIGGGLLPGVSWGHATLAPLAPDSLGKVVCLARSSRAMNWGAAISGSRMISKRKPSMGATNSISAKLGLLSVQRRAPRGNSLRVGRRGAALGRKRSHRRSAPRRSWLRRPLLDPWRAKGSGQTTTRDGDLCAHRSASTSENLGASTSEAPKFE